MIKGVFNFERYCEQVELDDQYCPQITGSFHDEKKIFFKIESLNEILSYLKSVLNNNLTFKNL